MELTLLFVKYNYKIKFEHLFTTICVCVQPPILKNDIWI
jgi:hypothetical protein